MTQAWHSNRCDKPTTTLGLQILLVRVALRYSCFDLLLIRDELREADEVDERPEAPGRAQRRPRCVADIAPHGGQTLSREESDDRGVHGVQVDAPDGLIGHHLCEDGVPRPAEVQMALHPDHPVVTQRPVADETRSPRAGRAPQIQVIHLLAQQNLGQRVPQAVGHTAGARLDKDGVCGDRSLVRFQRVLLQHDQVARHEHSNASDDKEVRSAGRRRRPDPSQELVLRGSEGRRHVRRILPVAAGLFHFLRCPA
eukprot:scaffold3504_cov240-Pinguiococcus_pyrenoidosus.AAC.21